MKRLTWVVISAITLFILALPAAATTIKYNLKTSTGGTTTAYVWRTNKLVGIKLADGKIEKTVTFPFTWKVKSVSYDSTAKKIAYVTTSGNIDKAKIRNVGSQLFHTLLTVDHSSADSVEASGRIFGATLLPDHSNVLVQTSGWEGCNDMVLRNKSYFQIYSEWCNSLNWSANGQRFSSGTFNGIGTGNTLFLGTAPSYSSYSGEKPTQKSLTQIDWKTATLDGQAAATLDSTNYYYPNFGIDYAAITNNGKIGVLALDNSSNYFIATYDAAKNVFSTVLTLGKIEILKKEPKMMTVGNHALITTGKKLYDLNIASGAISSVTMNIIPAKNFNISLTDRIGAYGVINISSLNSSGKVTGSKQYLVDADHQTFKPLPFAKGDLFAGL